MAHRIAVLWGLVAGCTGGEAEDLAPPCEGGGWGLVSEPGRAVHVRSDGDDAGDGTQLQPLATLSAALEAARGGSGRIAVGPGSFPAALDLLEQDAGLRIEGCGVEETVLVGEVDGEPILKVTEATGVSVAGLTLSEADRPLFVWGGAEVEARSVSIADARWAGFVVDGPYTLLDLEDVTVCRTREVGGAGGFGGEVDGGALDWRGGGVVDSVGVGLVASGETALLSLSGLEISGTAPAADGRFGRGVQIQDYASASLSSCTLSDNRDAGLFALLASELALDGVAVEGVAAGSGPGGDGIVITGIDADGRRLDPGLFEAELSGNTVGGVERAGVLLERVTATLDGNVVDGTAPDRALVAQEDAVTSGADPVVVVAEPLALERAAIAVVGAP